MQTQVINVLVIEDNPFDARLLRVFLSEQTSVHFKVTTVARLQEALDLLAGQSFDVVLCDLSLPDSQGFHTFQRVRTQAPHTPILVLSGLDDESLAIRAVREGAQEYLVKGKIDGSVLSRAITYAIERHRAEQALQERERRYRYLLESVTDYTYSVKLEDGRPVEHVHGPGCESITGFTPEEYEADPHLWLRMVHEDDRAAVLDQEQKVLRGQTPPPLEHRIIRKDGRICWVRNSVVPAFDRNGKLVAYDGLISDITERKQAEEKLVTSEAFYHSLVENLPQNIFRKDLQERFTFANSRFCALLGRKLEEIVGKTDFDFYPPELAAKYQRDDRHVIETGQTFETVEVNQTPDGEKRYVQVIKTPIFDSHGRIIGIQGIFWDITERKRWEQRLQEANRELARSEAALRKSHEELKAAQLQLIQAEKMESIGTLAAGVAHEVKNPLAIILMGVSLLQKRLGTSDPQSAQILEEIQEAVSRADSITRRLLEFAGTHQLKVEPVQLNELLEHTFPLIRHELSKRQIELHTELGAGLPTVMADRQHLQQVFLNVFMNAIQAMEEKGRLTVRTYVRHMTETTHFEGSRKADHFWVGDRAVIAEVDDTGPGIPQENLARIFDPFFTTKPTGVGTGLGLPISKKIVELHGGDLNVTNRPEGGVRVTIKLRAKRG